MCKNCHLSYAYSYAQIAFMQQPPVKEGKTTQYKVGDPHEVNLCENKELTGASAQQEDS